MKIKRQKQKRNWWEQIRCHTAPKYYSKSIAALDCKYLPPLVFKLVEEVRGSIMWNDDDLAQVWFTSEHLQESITELRAVLSTSPLREHFFKESGKTLSKMIVMHNWMTANSIKALLYAGHGMS